MTIEIIQQNFTTVITLVFMLVFLWTNVTFDKRIVKLFIIANVLLLLAAIADNGELITGPDRISNDARAVLLTISNVFRPVVLYVVLLILISNVKTVYRVAFCAPAVINALVFIIGFKSHSVFHITRDGELILGNVYGIAQICTIVYLLIGVTFLAKDMIIDRVVSEAMVMIAITVVIVFTLYLSNAHHFVGLRNSVDAVGLTFFYLFYHTESFKKDPLTGVLNRRCFYLDAEKFRTTITAIVSIDLNNLKYINDNMGHDKGDIAICTMVNTVRKDMLSNCRLYRTGGDEFQLICQNHSINKVYGMVEKIQKDMRETSYTWAMGVVDVNLGKDLDELLARADEAMYENKKKVKLENKLLEEEKRNKEKSPLTV